MNRSEQSDPRRCIVRTAAIRAGAAALAILAAVALVVGSWVVPAAAAPPTQDGPEAAGYGAAWLAAQLGEQIPMINFGGPDWGVTLDAALSLSATGVGRSRLDAVWAALVADREQVVAPSSAPGVAGDASVGRLARVILLAEALGNDPRAVGEGPGADMVARLVETRRAEGPDAGLFGVQDPTYDGAFRQGYALAALVAAGETPDPSAADWLVSQQCRADGADGAWMAYRADTTVPCAFDPDLYVGPDTNATAAAIGGLDAVEGGAGAIERGLSWLDLVQNDDGGWGQLPPADSEPSSTALVIQALIAVGQADAPGFSDRSATPTGALVAFQLGCDAPEPDRGALTYPGSNDAPNGFATAQGVAALAGAPMLAAPGAIADGVTSLACAAPTTVPSTTTTPTSPAPTPTDAPAVADPVPAGNDAPQAEVLSTTESSGTTSSTPTTSTTSSVAAGSLAATGADHLLLGPFGAALVVLGLTVLAADRHRRRGAGA